MPFKAMPFLLGLFLFLASPSFAQQDSVSAASTSSKQTFADVQKNIWKHQAMEAAKYIRANPNAEDEVAALNVILQALQDLEKFKQMIPFLERRYEVLKKRDPDNVEAIFAETAATILSLHHQFNHHNEVKKWRDRLFIDWVSSPNSAEVDNLLVWFNREFAMPQIGQDLAFNFTDLDGTRHDLKAESGNVILLNFWDSTCDVCRDQKPFIAAALEAYADRGLKVFGFAVDEDRKALDAYLEKTDTITWPQIADNDPRHELMRRLNLPGVPMNFLIDQTGAIMALDLRENEILQAIDAAFGVEPRATPQPEAAPDTDGLLNILE